MYSSAAHAQLLYSQIVDYRENYLNYNYLAKNETIAPLHAYSESYLNERFYLASTLPLYHDGFTSCGHTSSSKTVT